ncbi:MAG: M56 family metallopeptidase [Armatimonadota bacterium]
MDLSPVYPFLVAVTLRGVALLALAGVIALGMRRASAAQRHLVWTIAVIGALLLPLFSVILPKWQPATNAGPLRQAYRVLGHQEIPLATITAIVKPAPSPEALPAPSQIITAFLFDVASLDWGLIAFGLWGLVAAVFIVRWLAGFRVIRRVVREATPVEATWQPLADDAAWLLRLRRPVRMRQSAHIAVPIVCGTLNPCLLLPEGAEDWPEERRRAVLIHEFAHIARGDVLTQWLAQLAFALFWFNPLIWLATHRMRVEREAACDDRVLQSGVKASEYASYLLETAGRLNGRSPMLDGVAMARTSQLGRRLHAVLDPWLYRSPITQQYLVVSLTFSLGIVVLLAVTQQDAAPRAYAAVATGPKNFDYAISPGGEHIAFITRQGDRYAVVVDGKAGRPYYRVHSAWPRQPSLVFSPNGKRLAFAVTDVGNPDKVRMVEDGREGPECDALTVPVFSRDSRRVAYAARQGKQWRVLINGVAGSEWYDRITEIAFSHDGSSLAVAAEKNGRAFMVVSGKAGPAHDGVKRPVFGTHGKLAYIAIEGDRRHVVLDGTNEKPYRHIDADTLQFSPDGRLAYVAQVSEHGWTLVCNGSESPVYASINAVRFSPNGRRLAYTFSRNLQHDLVLDGKIIPNAWRPAFSPDSAHFAYISHRQGVNVVVRDGQAFPLPHNLIPDQLCFSPDSRRLLCLAADRGKPVLLVDGKPRASCDVLLSRAPADFCFFPDPNHVHFFSYADRTVTRVEERLLPEQKAGVDVGQTRRDPVWALEPSPCNAAR